MALSEARRRQQYLDRMTGGDEVTTLKQLVERCLDDDPDERPPIQEVKQIILPLTYPTTTMVEAMETVVTDHEDYLSLAKAAEKAERYEDMAKYMEEYIKKCPGKFPQEVRNLLSVAFKNVAGKLRSCFSNLSAIDLKSNEQMEKLCIAKYQAKASQELRKICKRVLVSLILYTARLSIVLCLHMGVSTQDHIFHCFHHGGLIP